MHCRFMVSIIFVVLSLASACSDSFDSGSTKAKALSTEGMDMRPGGPFIVFDLPPLEGSEYHVIGIHMTDESKKYELKKLYKNGTKKVREALEPGTYKYRVVYINTDSKILYDSSTCEKTASYKEVTIKRNEEKFEAVKLCPPEASGGAALEPNISEFDKLHNPEYVGAGWPALPRRYLSLGQNKTESTTLSVELGAKTWLLSAAISRSFNVKAAFKTDVTLIKHAPTPGTVLLVPGSSSLLAYEEGVAFVAQCNYTGSITSTTSDGFTLGISKSLPTAILGITLGPEVEIARGLAIEKSTAVQAQSKMVPIEPGSTAEEIKKRCETLFSSEVKYQVHRDLKLAAENILYADQRENFELIYEAAVNGPNVEGVAANGNRWNIEKAQIVHHGDSMTIAGAFARRVDLWFDSNFCYKIKVEGSDRSKRPRISYHRYDNCSGNSIDAGWFEAGKDIAKNIAIEAWQNAPTTP